MVLKPIPVWVHSLGCPKNRVDTERALGSLGYPVRLVRHIGQAKLVFINTCSFIEPASRESVRAILEAADRIKNLRRKPVLAVAGCLPSRYGLEELACELPEVDVWLPASRIASWPDLLNQALGRAWNGESGRLLAGVSSFGWLKISDGCNHKCAFCAIPAIRGKFVSEPGEKIVAEAGELLEKGVKELVLVAQDVGAWGRDGGLPDYDLPYLLRKLAGLTGLVWLRMLYLYPNTLTSDFLQNVAEIGAPILPYFDIPLQHSEPEVLARMGRPFQENPRAVLERLRQFFPQAALRTTLIVGYPGETEAQFRRMLEFVREARFQNLGVFTYFAEEGTPAAAFPQQISQEVKEERRRELMEAQAAISRELLAQYVGTRQQVLVDESREEEWPGLHAGRLWFQAPEIDGITYVSGQGVHPGALVEGEIVDSQVYDLSALAQPS